MTWALKPNDFQFRFYGRGQVGGQKTRAKILNGMDRDH